jgi:hypothetical protein
LHTLIYISKAVNPLPDGDLLDLLSASRFKNVQNNLSGMLLYVKQYGKDGAATGRFIQALEGEEEDVLRLYDIIKQDTRHRQVTLLHTGPIDTHNFAGWSMGFRSLLEDEYLQIPGYIKLDEQFIQSKSMLSLGVALNFLKTFYSIPA